VTGLDGSPRFDAVILAGGRGRRLGGVDKAQLELGGARLVDRVARAARAVGAAQVIVVGPEDTLTSGGVVVREDPPFSGPLAALAAGLTEVHQPWVMLLPCDLARPDALCAALSQAWRSQRQPGDDGLLLRDSSGRQQWLAGVYSASMLRGALAALGGDCAGLPLRRVFQGAQLREASVDDSVSFDIDRPEDLARAGREVE
jgi:molybdopterin-guanine dinucleotide biosynthesis protein A